MSTLKVTNLLQASSSTNNVVLTSSGDVQVTNNLQFNSGYGSAATAYGCRAWVNFDGTTASPSTRRGSGNVSSVTKNGTGDYTVNFTTAMPDANYAVTCSSRRSAGTLLVSNPLPGGTYTTNAIQVNSASVTPTNQDADYYSVAIFR